MSEVLQVPSCWKGKWQIPTKQRNPIWDGIRVRVRKKVPLLHHLPLSSLEGNFTPPFWSHCKELTQLGTPFRWDKTGKCTPAACLMHRTTLQTDKNNNPRLPEWLSLGAQHLLCSTHILLMAIFFVNEDSVYPSHRHRHTSLQNFQTLTTA